MKATRDYLALSKRNIPRYFKKLENRHLCTGIYAPKLFFMNVYVCLCHISLQEILTEDEYVPEDFDSSSLNSTARALYLYNNNVATKVQNYLKKNFNRSIIEVEQIFFIT